MYVLGGWRGKGWAAVAGVAVMLSAAGCQQERQGEEAGPTGAPAAGPEEAPAAATVRWNASTDGALAASDQDEALLSFGELAQEKLLDRQGDPTDWYSASLVEAARAGCTPDESLYRPFAAGPERESAVRAAVDAYARAVFPPELLPPPEAWRLHARVQESETPEVARAAFRQGLTFAGGNTVEVEGALWLDSSRVRVVAHVEGDVGPDPRLETVIPTVALRWPPGYLDAVRPSVETAGEGVRWASMGAVDGRRGVLDARGTMVWPYGVASWSDGEWVVLVCPAVSSRGAARNQSLMVGPAVFAGQSLENLGQGLQRDRELEERPRATLRPISDAMDEALSLAPEVQDRLGQQSESGAGPRGLGLTLVARDEWEQATPGPIPDSVAACLEADLTGEALLLSVEDYPRTGDGVAGLLHATDDDERDPMDMLVQWVLGEDALAVLAIPRTAAGLRSVGSGAEGLADRLPRLLGPQGRSLLLTAQPEDDNHRLARPDPEAMVGPFGDRRLGDRTWGRVTLETDATFVRLVFDLNERE